MIDGSEKRNRQLAFAFRIRMFVKSAVREVPIDGFLISTDPHGKNVKQLLRIFHLFSMLD